MIKQLFIETLPLSDVSPTFHELALILVVNDEVKCAYHYKMKFENNRYNEDTINGQGYEIEDIKKNPQYAYEVYTSILKILDMHINKYLNTDLCILYAWDLNSVIGFMDFINNEGFDDWEKYFCGLPVSVSSLVIDKIRESIHKYEPFTLQSLSQNLLGEFPEKDAMSRLIEVYKLYRLSRDAKS